MIENKRFDIKPSSIVDDCFVIIDNESKYSFPTLENTLNHMFCKALNELNDESKELKKRVEDLEFALRTELAHQRVEKKGEDFSDTCYDFEKKLDTW